MDYNAQMDRPFRRCVGTVYPELRLFTDAVSCAELRFVTIPDADFCDIARQYAELRFISRSCAEFRCFALDDAELRSFTFIALNCAQLRSFALNCAQLRSFALTVHAR